MNKFVKLTALSLALGFVSNVAMAQENIGLVNVQYLYSHHPDRQAAFEKLQSEFKEPAAKLQKEEKEFLAAKDKFAKEVEAKVKALEKDAPKLKQAQIKQRQQEIEKFAQQREGELKGLYERFQSASMAFNAENQQAVMAANQRLLKEIQLATDKVAQQKKYTLVLDEKAAVYAAKGKDITQEVLKALEETKVKAK